MSYFSVGGVSPNFLRFFFRLIQSINISCFAFVDCDSCCRCHCVSLFGRHKQLIVFKLFWISVALAWNVQRSSLGARMNLLIIHAGSNIYLPNTGIRDPRKCRNMVNLSRLCLWWVMFVSDIGAVGLIASGSTKKDFRVIVKVWRCRLHISCDLLHVG